MNDYKALYLHFHDNVAVALSNIPEQTTVPLQIEDQRFTVKVLDAIRFGHKFATRMIKQGEDIKKYGEVIGIATSDIHPGHHVHVHNLTSKPRREV